MITAKSLVRLKREVCGSLYSKSTNAFVFVGIGVGGHCLVVDSSNRLRSEFHIGDFEKC